MANEGLGDQVKAGKELRGLMSDTGKIYSEIRKLGKDNEKILGGTVSKARQLWIIEAQLAKGRRLTIGDAKKLQQQQNQIDPAQLQAAMQMLSARLGPGLQGIQAPAGGPPGLGAPPGIGAPGGGAGIQPPGIS